VCVTLRDSPSSGVGDKVQLQVPSAETVAVQTAPLGVEAVTVEPGSLAVPSTGEPSVGASKVACDGGVESTVKATVPVAVLVLPVLSDCVAVRSAGPSARAGASTQLQLPSGSTVALQVLLPAVTVTVLPVSPVPEMRPLFG
jgi:hypothetical protein